MLIGFHRAWACQRPADEAQSHGFEFPWRQIGCGISSPETVPVSRNDREAGDLRFAHVVVNFLSLGVGRSVVVTAELRISICGPRLLDHSGWEVLRVRAPVERAERIAPDFPRRSRFAQLVLEPGLLVGAEDGARWRLLSRIRNAHIAEVELGGRPPAVEGASRVERDHRLLGKHSVEGRVINFSNPLSVSWVVAAEAVLVSNEEVKVLAVAEHPISDQTADRGQIVRL